ncbi:MAG: phosphate propanoyltransferase [Spirochaetaceae bacterium]|nr:phosphate propanoyltransferase [Spirochaetaceae bacterium]
MDKAEIRAIVEKVLSRRGLFAPPQDQTLPQGRMPLQSQIPTQGQMPPEPRQPPEPGKLSLEVSARHVHLTREAVKRLFGGDEALRARRALSQPGEFLSEQRVRLKGPDGVLDNVAILGPERGAVQVELSLTDARMLGIDAPLRLSGDLSDAAEVEIEGPSGSIRAKAAIVAKIHLHLRPVDAETLGLKNGSSVCVRVKSRRPLTFEDVPVRVRDDFMPALHIDFDEANACMYRKGDSFEILSSAAAGKPAGAGKPARNEAAPRRTGRKTALVTEADAKKLVRTGGKIQLPGGTIVTPAAKDVFYEAHCRIEWEQ